MNAEERSTKRHEIFMGVYIKMQLFGLYSTYGTFLDEFEWRVAKELGECTEEDKEWGFATLDRIVKLNSMPEKKKKRKGD